VKPPARPEVKSSEALSLFARPGKGGIATRRIALLVADGVDATEVSAVQQELLAQGAVPRVVGIKLGAVRTSAGPALEIEVSMETAPSVLWDALIVFGSAVKNHPLANSGHAKEFLKDQYRHCKPILLHGSAQSLLAAAGVPTELPSKKADPGLIVSANLKGDRDLNAFVTAVARHRQFERETDPPRV